MSVHHKEKKAQRGFTLIELMITLGVFAILAGLAVPSYQDYMANQRARALAQDLYSSLMLARSEAIKRNADVTVKAASANWAEGWAVSFEGSEYSSCLAGAGDCLRVRQADTSAAVSVTNDVTAVTYSRTGRIAGSNHPSFTVCDAASMATEREVRIDLSGRPVITLGQACS